MKSVQYSDDDQELLVTFSSGWTYRYTGVDGNEADGFSSASSAGEYLHRYIKPSHPAERIA